MLWSESEFDLQHYAVDAMLLVIRVPELPESLLISKKLHNPCPTSIELDLIKTSSKLSSWNRWGLPVVWFERDEWKSDIWVFQNFLTQNYGFETLHWAQQKKTLIEFAIALDYYLVCEILWRYLDDTNLTKTWYIWKRFRFEVYQRK